MKTKKKGIAVLSVIIVIAAVLLTVFSQRIINGIEDAKASEYTESDLKNVDNIVLLSHCAEVDGKTNSVAGVKEAVRLGAGAVVVDMCFKENGTPVMSDDYGNVDSAPPLEDLFKALKTEKYLGVKIYLNIVQLSDMTKLNKLAVDYDLLSRLTLIGIDADHYGLITKDDTIIPFYLEKDFSSEEHSEMRKGTFSVPEELDEYGASGLVVKASEADETVIEALDDYGIPFIVTSVNNNRKLSEVLLANAQTVWVNDIEKSEKFLSEWIKEMQIRYENSVASSLKALSTTTKNK